MSSYAFGHLLWELVHCETIFAGEKALAVLIQRTAGLAGAMPPWTTQPPPALARGYQYALIGPPTETASGCVAAAMEPQLWAEVVALVSECWKLEAVARPDARSLERRMVSMGDSLTEPPASSSCVLQECVVVPSHRLPNAMLEGLATSMNTAKLENVERWVEA